MQEHQIYDQTYVQTTLKCQVHTASCIYMYTYIYIYILWGLLDIFKYNFHSISFERYVPNDSTYYMFLYKYFI